MILTMKTEQVNLILRLQEIILLFLVDLDLTQIRSVEWSTFASHGGRASVLSTRRTVWEPLG